MKFLALKDALSKWESTQPKQSEIKTTTVVPRYFSAIVVGGIDRIPIDRTARLVTSKAPWWAVVQENKRKDMLQDGQFTEGVNKQRNEPVDQATRAGLCNKVIGKTDKALESSLELYNRTCDARQALEVLSKEWKAEWFEFIDTCDKRITDLRTRRMAILSETEKILNGFKDIRNFMMDKDHEREIARLQEFVSLCERLQKLKESGFLDTVADTMLKLSS